MEDQRARIHWAAARVWWTGKDFTVSIPAYIDPQPAVWIIDNLVGRLPVGPVRITAAVPGTPPAAAYKEPGEITIEHLTAPWPNLTELRDLLVQVVNEAYAAATEAQAEATELLRQVHALVA
jgi:hypothetical protein